jgi:maltoporin
LFKRVFVCTLKQRVLRPTALTVAVLTPSIALADEGFQFNGYYRAGINTPSPFTGREFVEEGGGNSFYRFFESLTLETPDTQGSPRLKTSRHTREPNYLKIQMSKYFPSEVKFTFGMDTKDATAHATATTPISSSDSESSIIAVNNSFRIRDLFLELPTATDMRIWAGSRQIEFEDLRLFEAGNPFDTKALGFGIETSNSFFSLGFSKSKRQGVVEGISELDRISNKVPPVLVETKDASLVYRKEIAVDSNYTVIPMVKAIIHGAARADATTGGRRLAIRGSQELLIGAVMARQDPETGGFGNTTMGASFRPAGYDEAALRGDTRGYDSVYFLQDTSVFNFIDWSFITGLSVEHSIFKNDQTVYVVQDDGAIISTGETTKTQRTVAVGAQPVLYINKVLHLALDLSYSFRNKKIDKLQSNAFLVTPILRYALNENVLGSPQIYTSFTYGKYDLDFKRQLDGSFKNTLTTTQSGIELWF